MINIIRIKKAVFYAYHGALEEEQSIGGKFEADVDMYTSFEQAAHDDDLHETINYVSVYKFINELVHEKKYRLIETLAMNIAERLLEKFPSVQKVAVRVRKNSVPIGGLIDCVEAEVIKENGK